MSKTLSENVITKERKLSFSNKEIETIRRTVAEKANDDEFKMFMYLAKKYGLDPINGEIFFWKMKGKPTIMTSRDGYLKIADRHPAYDGLVSDVVRKKDNFRRKVDGIEHEYGADRGAIKGAYALVYRKDRRYPIYVFAPFEEYNAGTRAYSQYPSAMILKVAESMALKRAFTVSGLVTREEMDVIQDRDDSIVKTPKCNENKKEKDSNKEMKLTERELEIKDIVGDDKLLKKDMYSFLKFVKEDLEMSDNQKLSLDDLTDKQYNELKDLLTKIKNRDYVESA